MQKHRWLCSSIGRKQLIGLTGLGLSGFVLLHMLGNLLIFKGPQAYNEYSHALTSNPLLIVAEVGLLAMFIGHLVFAIWISWKNYWARPEKYAVIPHGEKGTSMVMRSLWAQGLLILVFVILHLSKFKYGPLYTVDYGHGPIRDLFKIIVEEFHETGEVIWYVVAVVVLGFHLSHGVGSSLQTLGINHPKYNFAFRGMSLFYAIAVTAGFVAQPLYVFFLT